MGAAISSPITVHVAADILQGSGGGFNPLRPESRRCCGASPPLAMKKPGSIPILTENGRSADQRHQPTPAEKCQDRSRIDDGADHDQNQQRGLVAKCADLRQMDGSKACG